MSDHYWPYHWEKREGFHGACNKWRMQMQKQRDESYVAYQANKECSTCKGRNDIVSECELHKKWKLNIERGQDNDFFNA